MPSTVSIIVPVRKGDEPEAWLAQCLESIKSQDYQPIEIIVEDDFDESGAAATRNRGLDKSTGQLIMFCDADDYLAPNAVSKLVKAIDFQDMAVGSFRKFGDFEETVTGPTGEMLPKHVAEYVMGNLQNPRSNQALSGCWAKMFRRNRVGRFPLLTTAEDMAFNFDYLARCRKVKFISDVVYHNRKHTGSLSTTYDENNRPGLFGFLKGLKYVKTYLSHFYPENEIDDAIDNSKMYHAMLYFSRICDQNGGKMRDVLRKLYP